MPVTFSVAKVSPDPIHPDKDHWRFKSTKGELLDRLSPLDWRNPGVEREILQSSIIDADLSTLSTASIGIVGVVYEAYNRHLHLEIRPDDVWTTILCQFSYYVNAHAEELRKHFVAHEGKKTLEIKTVGTRYTVDFGAMAMTMTRLIDENLLDEGLKDWILPQFSTTTPSDTVLYSIQMMAAFKEYFDYKISTLCGIPSVTLLGDKSDWEDILARVSKLRDFGEEPTIWADRLTPILERFIKCFDDPEIYVDFWNRVASMESLGSGDPILSGWITAFAFWTSKGQRRDGGRDSHYKEIVLGGPVVEEVKEKKTFRFGGKELNIFEEGGNSFKLVIDGQKYHPLSGIPDECMCEAPVKLDDNGEKFDTIMMTHHIAQYFSSKGSGPLDSIRMQPIWMLYVNPEGDGNAGQGST